MSSGPVWCRPGPAVAARAPTALLGASSQTWRRPDVGGVDAGKAGTYSTVLQSRTKLRKHCVLVCVWMESRKTTGKTHRNNQQILKTTSKRKSCVLADNPAAITMFLWCILLQAEEKRELPSPLAKQNSSLSQHHRRASKPGGSSRPAGPGQSATRRRPVLTILMPLICPLRKGSVLGGARRPGSGSATAAPAAGWRRVGLAGAPCRHGSVGSPS